MVSKESLQNYAEKAFDGLECSVEASRNLNNGKFLLLVSLSETDLHSLTLDENALNSDMESSVRELRDRLFPPKPESKTDPAPPPADEVELAEIVDARAPPPAPVTQPDPFPATEVTKASKPPKGSAR